MGDVAWMFGLVAAGLMVLVLWSSSPSPREVTYPALLEQVRDGEVNSVELHVGSGDIDVTRVDGSSLTVQGPPGAASRARPRRAVPPS